MTRAPALITEVLTVDSGLDPRIGLGWHGLTSLNGTIATMDSRRLIMTLGRVTSSYHVMVPHSPRSLRRAEPTASVDSKTARNARWCVFGEALNHSGGHF
jgi:hypothetical protein